jgi:hypothetical protein
LLSHFSFHGLPYRCPSAKKRAEGMCETHISFCLNR